MANSFFNGSNKAYSENLNDGILVGNAFDWTVDVSLPEDTGSVFPNSSTIVMAKVADVYITPNSNLSIGSTVSNSSGSSQVYRLTVYPNFNRFGGFKSISLTADSGVTFYIANKGGTSPIVNNLDYSDLSNVPELKVLKEYDIVLTIPNGKSVSGLEFVFQSSSASVCGSIAQSNVTGLGTALNGKVDKVTNKGLSTNDFTNAYKTKLDDIDNWEVLGTESSQSQDFQIAFGNGIINPGALEVNRTLRLAHLWFDFTMTFQRGNQNIGVSISEDYKPKRKIFQVGNRNGMIIIGTTQKDDGATSFTAYSNLSSAEQTTVYFDVVYKY